MQAVKEKLEDMKEMRRVKAEAKAEEKAEKELAKARLDVAHEIRLAKEAEASMDMHVDKAGRKVEKEFEKHGVARPLTTNMVGDRNLNEANNFTHNLNPLATGNTATSTFTHNLNPLATGNTATSTTANPAGAPSPTKKYM